MKHSTVELKQMQGLPLNIKIRMTKRRIRDWYDYTEELREDGIPESRVIAVCSRFRKHTDWCHNEPTELYLDVKDICLTEEEAKGKFEKLYG